jgi:hypothetical protein
MKKLVLGILVSASLIACTNTEKKTETVEQKSTPIEHIISQLIQIILKLEERKMF